MIKLVLKEVIEALDGDVRGPLPALSVCGVSSDSRSLAPGEVFFAIAGPRFDGHDFVGQALARGARAAVVDASKAAAVAKALPVTPQPHVLIEVDDTLAALGRLAAYHRRQVPTEVIAVVGSNGKTTTKAMIDHLLGARLRGRCSPKSFNNAIGVPLTLLQADSADDYLVVEIGTNAPGEVAALAELAAPDLAVVTCLGEEHLEGLGDLAGVAQEECSIFGKLRSGGFAAVNLDNPIVHSFLPVTNGGVAKDPDYQGLALTTFGWNAEADLRLSEARYEAPWLRFVLNDRFEYRLRAPGAHNAVNATGAITIARRLGLAHDEIAARLESFVLPPMRGQIVNLAGITLVNDAYNANPHSALAAIDMLESLPCTGRRIVVFGEMRELGALSSELHRRVAERLTAGSVDQVLLVGAAAEWMGPVLDGAGRLLGPAVGRCDDVTDCLATLVESLRAGDVVLLKASRAVELERIVEPLRSALTERAAAAAG